MLIISKYIFDILWKHDHSEVTTFLILSVRIIIIVISWTFHIQDVLQMNFLDLMKQLCLSAQQVRDLQTTLYGYCTPSHCTVRGLTNYTKPLYGDLQTTPSHCTVTYKLHQATVRWEDLQTTPINCAVTYKLSSVVRPLLHLAAFRWNTEQHYSLTLCAPGYVHPV